MKKWFNSKTIWANLLVILAFGIERFVGTDFINAEIGVLLIGFINLILRFITSEPIQTKKELG